MSYANFMQPQAKKPAIMTFTRKAHRWIGIVFLITVAGNFAAMAFGTPPTWVTYAPLPFLFVMMATGLVMEVRLFILKKRSDYSRLN